jgi:pimeloyl-ACP methyl ester carboxylesterase
VLGGTEPVLVHSGRPSVTPETALTVRVALVWAVTSDRCAWCSGWRRADPETTHVMAVAQRPFTKTAFGAPSGPVAWRSVPSWYLLGSEDKAIPPATQRYMAERAKASIVEIPASDASMVSQPDAVTELILTAVNATAGRRAVGASG